MERYQRIYLEDNALYVENSSLIVCAQAILKDTVTREVIGQAKFQNIGYKKIVAIIVDVLCFDVTGNVLQGIWDYQYLDLQVARDGYFGSQNAILLPDFNTRKISIEVKKIVYSDGTTWINNQSHYLAVPEIVSLSSDPEVQKEAKNVFGVNAPYRFHKTDELWRCVCGVINRNHEKSCHFCHVSMNVLEEHPLSVLIESKNQRLAETERVRKEQEIAEKNYAIKRKAKIVKLIKRTLIATISILVVSILLFKVAIPSLKNYIVYKNAQELLEIGQYDSAAELFDTLGEYKDASVMVMESEYQKAEYTLRNGDVDTAIEIWELLNGYLDSDTRVRELSERMNEEAYQEALLCLNEGKYSEAEDKFRIISGYKDSMEKLNESISLQKDAEKELIYQEVMQNLDKGYFMSAIDSLERIKGYKDVDELYVNTVYNYANKLLSEKSYTAAIKYFQRISEVMEVESKILEAKYGHVITYDRDNPDVLPFLEELVSINYPGAKNRYKELYEWKVNVAFNKVGNLNYVINQIGKNKSFEVHVYAYAGPPGQVRTGAVSYVYYPDGKVKKDVWSDDVLTMGILFQGGFCLSFSEGVNCAGELLVVVEDHNGKELGRGSIYITE